MKANKSSVLSKIMALGIIAVLIIPLCFLDFSHALDHLLLIEYKLPEYYRYLESERAKEVLVDDKFYDISIDQIRQENLFKNVYTGDFYSVQISQDNGVISFDGRVSEDVWLGFSPETSAVTSGTYFLDLGGDVPTDISLYFEGTQNGTQVLTTNNLRSQYIYIDSSLYDHYSLTMALRKGQELNFKINPVLYRISDENIIDSMDKYVLWDNVPKNSITDHDMRAFENSLYKYDGASYKGCVIRYDDGEVSAYVNHTKYPAEFDELGRIYINYAAKDQL